TLRGSLDHPVLIGRMEAATGTVQFNNSTFNLLTGTVDFTNPEFIEPLIDVKAQTTVTAGPTSRSYQIILELSGTPDKLETTLTADDPTLTRTDILALLLSGRGTSGSAQTSGIQQSLPVPITIGTQLELPIAGQVSFEPAAPSTKSGAAPRVSVEQRMLGDRFILTYAYIINPTQDQIIKMEYMLNRNMSLQGIRNDDGTLNSNLKFRFEFK
ncbi:MAG TPA: translocation/assembly module TamB domain-containing protein, partial [Nitrospiria bacterium]|nr:translocation/assembly module TamB domain-containing protein [Nitrospiria bacterium]